MTIPSFHSCNEGIHLDENKFSEGNWDGRKALTFSFYLEKKYKIQLYIDLIF